MDEGGVSGSQCPQGLNQAALLGSNYCGRLVSDSGYVSTVFETYNLTYTQVCGRLSGHQYGSTDGFWNYCSYEQTSIGDYYVYGVLLTDGQLMNTFGHTLLHYSHSLPQAIT